MEIVMAVYGGGEVQGRRRGALDNDKELRAGGGAGLMVWSDQIWRIQAVAVVRVTAVAPG